MWESCYLLSELKTTLEAVHKFGLYPIFTENDNQPWHWFIRQLEPTFDPL